MNFKKYNLILVFMLALVIAIPIVSLSAKSNSSSTDISEELPPVAEIDTSDQSSSSSKSTSYKFSSNWAAYRYLLNSSLNQSFYVETTQTLTPKAVGISFSQSVKCKTYVTTDGKIYEEAYSSGEKQFFNTTFYDGTNVYTKTVDGEYEVGNQPSVTPDKYGVDEYLKENGVLPGFLMKLNKNCFSGAPVLINGRYYVKATVTDSSIWNDYLKKVQVMSGSSTFPTMNSFSMQFVYSAKTGKLLQIIINESYNIKYKGISVTCKSESVKNFSLIGTDVQLPNMSYMGM